MAYNYGAGTLDPMDPTKKKSTSGFGDAAGDQEAYQTWMGVQDQAKQQAAAPLAASQPAGTLKMPPAASSAPMTSVNAFKTEAPPPPPPPLPPMGGPAGATNLLPQRYDQTGATPDNAIPPADAQMGMKAPATTDYERWARGGAALKAPPQATQMESLAAPPAVPPATPPPLVPPAGAAVTWVDPRANMVSLKAPPAVPPATPPPAAPPATPPADLTPDQLRAWMTNFGKAAPAAFTQVTDPLVSAKQPPGTPPPTEPAPGTQIGDVTGLKPKLNPGGSQPPPPGGKQPVTPPSLNPGDYNPATTPAGTAASAFDAQFEAWLKDAMATKNPYSTDVVKQGQAVLEDALNRQRTQGLQAIKEAYAKRGLTGSSLEATEIQQFEAQIEEQYRAGLFQLGQAQVQAYQTQLSTVGGLGNNFVQNLTAQQQNQLASIRDQMSLSLQKYGIDKTSADAAANAQLQKEIADADRQQRADLFKQQAILDYGGNASQSQWDAYAGAYGQDAALHDLGPRPTGAASATQPSTTTTAGSQKDQSGNTIVDAQAGADQAAAAYKAQMQKPPTGKTAADIWDSYARLYGNPAATRNLGARPAGAPPGPVTFGTATSLTEAQLKNWDSVFQSVGQVGSYAAMPLATRQADWDKYSRFNGQDAAQRDLGPRPTT